MIVIDNNSWMLHVSLVCLVHCLKVSVEERVNSLAKNTGYTRGPYIYAGKDIADIEAHVYRGDTCICAFFITIFFSLKPNFSKCDTVALSVMKLKLMSSKGVFRTGDHTAGCCPVVA